MKFIAKSAIWGRSFSIPGVIVFFGGVLGSQEPDWTKTAWEEFSQQAVICLVGLALVGLGLFINWVQDLKGARAFNRRRFRQPNGRRYN